MRKWLNAWLNEERTHTKHGSGWASTLGTEPNRAWSRGSNYVTTWQSDAENFLIYTSSELGLKVRITKSECYFAIINFITLAITLSKLRIKYTFKWKQILIYPVTSLVRIDSNCLAEVKIHRVSILYIFHAFYITNSIFAAIWARPPR